MACSRSVGAGAGARADRMLFTLAVPPSRPDSALLPTRGWRSASGCACRNTGSSHKCMAAAGARGLRHGRRGAGAGRAGRLGGRAGARRGRRRGQRRGGARRRRARGRGRPGTRPGRRRPAPAAAQRGVAVDHLRARARAAAEQGHAVRGPRPPALGGVVFKRVLGHAARLLLDRAAAGRVAAGLHAPLRDSLQSGAPGESGGAWARMPGGGLRCSVCSAAQDEQARPLSAAQAAYAALDAHALVRIYDALAARVGRAALLALCGGRVAPGALAGRGGGASDGAASADGACREAGNGILRAPAVSLAGASERVPDSGSAPAVRDLNAPCDGAAAAGVWEASTVRESRLGQRADAVTHVCGAAGSRPSGLWIMRCCGSAVFGGTLLRGGRASGLRSAASGLRLRTAWRRMPGSGSAAAGRPPCAGSVAGGCRWLQSRAALQSRPLACLRGQLRSGCAAL